MISVANIFRYTIEDCEIVMTVTKNYVEKRLSSVSNPQRYMNYIEFLNLYNNRNDGIFIVLLHLLEELNTREYLAEGIYKATALSCFYNKYINSVYFSLPYAGIGRIR